MLTLDYPAELEADPSSGFVVTFPDFGYGVTEGDTREEALGHASDLLETLIASAIDDSEDLPTPSPANGRPLVTVRPLVAAKAGLYRALRQSGVSRTELARRLGWQFLQVQRLLDPTHKSSIEHVEQALRAIGKTLVVGVDDAA